MKKVKDFLWKQGMSVDECVDLFGNLGYQATELSEAVKVVLKMKRSGSKVFLTFTSNMVTSGLRGFFAQLCKLKIPNILVTTSGSIEEDIMKALGEDFELSNFYADDTKMHERGENRVGNLLIRNESYLKFEDLMNGLLTKIYEGSEQVQASSLKNQERKKKSKRDYPYGHRIMVSDLLKEIGLMLKDCCKNYEDSILYQAAVNDIPIYCPGIADSSFGFQLFMFQQKNKDFVVDTIQDMQRVVTDLSFDEKKGLISLGGSISKHYAVFAALLSGGFDYAVYLTTSHPQSGSMSGATTQEAKSWGKIKDDGEAATVNGDVCITFPLMMSSVLDKMKKENLLKDGS
jgi:deoxyhypusine synthase